MDGRTKTESGDVLIAAEGLNRRGRDVMIAYKFTYDERSQSAGRWKRSLHWQTALSPAPLHWVVMPGSIVVRLTDRECQALAELSQELDLPQDRVMIQALRHYQLAMHPAPSLPMMVESALCETCGIGFRLPSNRCDHCNCDFQA